MLDINTDAFFMREAIKQAKRAFEENEVPVGAIMVCNNHIIAKAYNQVEVLADATAHAEMICITSASEYLGAKFLNDCTLYVTLEPCMMCAGAIKWSRISKLVIAAADEKEGFITKYKANHLLNAKTEIIFGVEEKEAIQLLKDFFQKLRNNNQRNWN
ncbi:MAG: nucleoside deaminase [Bacteroidota bacterium]